MPFISGGTKKFALKGSKCRRVYGAHATGKLNIQGHFNTLGPQPVDDDGGVPVWIANYLDNNPDVDEIALSGGNHSVVYSRIVET